MQTTNIVNENLNLPVYYYKNFRGLNMGIFEGKTMSTFLKNKKFVMIASDPNNYEINDKFLKMDIEALKLSGLEFDKYLVLDNRSKENVDGILKDSDLIFLAGGKTLTQNIFFNDINLKKALKKLDCTIVGISAGSINLASNVYNAPEDLDDINNPLYLKGLDMTTINVIPHFNLYDLDDEAKKMQRESVLKESFNRTLIALVDKSYIYIKDNKSILYGEAYKIKDGNITRMCDDEKFVFLDNN